MVILCLISLLFKRHFIPESKTHLTWKISGIQQWGQLFPQSGVQSQSLSAWDHEQELHDVRFVGERRDICQAGLVLVWLVRQPQRNVSYGTCSPKGSACPACISPLRAPVLMALIDFPFTVLEVKDVHTLDISLRH